MSSKIMERVSLIFGDGANSDLTAQEKQQTKIVFGGIFTAFVAWYLALLYYSSQKWFHVVWLCILMYTSNQLYLFFVSQDALEK